mmetsp:Transcript_15735/g.36144  ORF Transcript_15735/g.36144 Transcript_15735/m.36144 type:complete len:248 (-) Transcript_15735:260-1003(-)
MKRPVLLCFVCLLGLVQAFSPGPVQKKPETVLQRRDFLQSIVAATGAGAVVIGSVSAPAWASGGATAGKYTTIPIAKRRYYGRVQQGVHDFLLMGPDIVKGDTTAEAVQHFFDPQGVVVVPAKRRDISGQCTKKDGDCAGKEVRDSRYNDMKTSMYLLGNAFRINQVKPPDLLPTVIAARAFFKEMDAMEKLVRKDPKLQDRASQKRYLAALDILDEYLDLVELPPTESGHYDQEFDTLVGETPRIT